MNFYALSSLVNGLSATALGILVYFRSTRNPKHLTYGMFCLTVSLWSYASFAWHYTDSREFAFLFTRLLMAGAILIPITYLHHILVSLDQLDKHRLLLKIGYALSGFFLLTNCTSYFIADLQPELSFKYWPKPGPAFHLFLVWFVSYAVYAIYLITTEYRRATGLQRNQYLYLLIGSLIGYGGGATNFPLWYGIAVPPDGTILVSVYTALVAYTIIRFRLMDITVVIHKGVAYGLLLAAIFIPVYLTSAASQRVSLYSAPPLFAGTLLFACGLWVFLKNPRALTNVTFGLTCSAASIWLFSFFLSYSATDETEARFWGKCVYVGVVYLPALVYHFCASLLHRRTHKRLIVSNYLISTVFLLLIPTPYLVNNQYHYFWGYYPATGILHPVFLLYFGAIGGLSLYQLYHGYHVTKVHSPTEAARLKYVFWAFAIGYLASLDFVQSYGHEFYPIGYVLTCVFVLIVTSAIVKFQLMGGALMPATPKMLPYLQALGLVPFYAVVLLLIRLFTGSMHYLLAGILLATFLAFAGVLAGLQKRIEKTIERVLFRQRYDAYETLIEFSKAMVTILDLSALNSTIMDTLARVLGIEKISVFLLDKERNQYSLAAAHGLDFDEMKTVTFSSSARLPQHLARTRSIVLLEELRQDRDDPSEQAVIDTLQVLHAELCIPLVNKDRLIGFFNFGKRASRSMYSEADLALLTTLAQNAAVALDNAMLYEDLRRSRLLMRRTDRLRSLETIAGGFAHEIRNPLTSIKTFVQLAPERKHDDEFIGHFSQIVHEDVLRIERLIQEILDYARYMEPKFSLENLNDIVISCLYFVEVKAESKNITVEKDFVRTLPSIMLDRQQIKQVLLNLLINAMEAMGDRGGRLAVRTRGLSKPDGDFWIQIEVQDTGPGIAPADLDHIFDPFYTTKHHSEEREGTGLGLTIVHQIVQEHHGYIEVESQPGRGTTFFINLPIRQPEDLFARERMEHEKTDSVGR